MDYVACLQAFSAVVRHGSFHRAAAELGVVASVVSKRVNELEQHLASSLLLRTTRRLQLTDAGHQMLDRARDILAKIDEMEQAIHSHGEVFSGNIRISAPTSFGIEQLARRLCGFRRLHPGLSVELALNDKPVNPLHDGYDLAIMDQPFVSEAGMSEQRLSALHRVICAAPDYLARAGTPMTPQALEHHACIHYRHLATGEEWHFFEEERERRVRIRPVLVTNNGLVMRNAAREGMGIALLPLHLIAGDLAAGRLLPLLTTYRLPQFWMVAVLPPLSRVSPKVQGLLQFLSDEFGPDSDWQQAR